LIQNKIANWPLWIDASVYKKTGKLQIFFYSGKPGCSYLTVGGAKKARNPFNMLDKINVTLQS